MSVLTFEFSGVAVGNAAQNIKVMAFQNRSSVNFEANIITSTTYMVSASKWTYI